MFYVYVMLIGTVQECERCVALVQKSRSKEIYDELTNTAHVQLATLSLRSSPFLPHRQILNFALCTLLSE